ncbi:MAG: tetratricopeptide repeat protein [Pseudomonadota bacterium]
MGRGEDPFVGFSAVHPLFEVKDGMVSTSATRVRFFNPVSFPEKKRRDTFRVFCLGGSTTYGHPFDERTAYPRWLEELLKASCPDKACQVINVGGISYASYRMVPLVREALQYQPDLMVIKAGHNEFLERRTYEGLIDRNAGLMRVEAALERLYLYRGLKLLLQPAVDGKSGPASKEDRAGKAGGGEKVVLHDEVTAVLDRSAGLNLYHRDEEFARGVALHFAHNLDVMVSLCQDAGVPVVLILPPSNLKDFSPFKSEHVKGLTPKARSEIEKKLKDVSELLNSKQFEKALVVSDEVIADDPPYALAHFLKGRALLGLGRYEEAGRSFIAARDYDVCPLRCPSPLLVEIEKVSKERGVTLIRFPDLIRNAMADMSDRSGIPGNESFLDHLHPTIEGNRLLAEELVRTVFDMRLVKGCNQLTKQDRNVVYSRVMGTLDRSFFAIKDLNLAKVLKWAGKQTEARVALERAAQVMEDNPEIHKLLGSYLLAEGRHADAVRQYEKAVELSGGDPVMKYMLAVAYFRAGQKARALAAYRELVDKGEKTPDAYANLAVIYLEEGSPQDAVKVLKSGLNRMPDSGALMAAYGLALAVSGSPSDGIPWMRRALEKDPGDPEYLYNLAGMYSLTGKPDQAVDSLEKAVKNGYANLEKLSSDPVFEPVRRDSRFQAILADMR